MTLYDPPSGWRYGFPKVYLPIPGETLAQTLLRDGYPQRELDQGGAEHCRFIGDLKDFPPCEVEDLPKDFDWAALQRLRKASA